MDHLAIMKKSWDLTKKILSGEKKIESRWYKSKYPPWGKIKSGDMIYFKDSGEPVSVRAKANKILRFSDLTPEKVKNILGSYWEEDGIAKEDIPKFFDIFKDKKYCILIFLKNPQKIEPFNIDKKGFGLMSAWICVDNISSLKK